MAIFKFYIIIAGSGLSGHAMAIVICSFCDSEEQATTLSMMLYMPSTLFCGFIVNQDSLNWLV